MKRLNRRGKIIFTILAIVLIFIFYKLYKFNKLDAKLEVFSVSQSDAIQDFAIVDDKYYSLENGKLTAYGKNGQIFSQDAKNAIKVLADKRIYTFDKDGIVRKLDRESGKEKDQVNLEMEIVHAEFQDDSIIVYGNDKVIRMNKKLKVKNTMDKEYGPVKYAFNNDLESVISLSLDKGKAISNYSLYQNQEKIFDISTSREVFLDTKIIGNKAILVSNAYIYVIENKAIVDKILLKNIQALDTYKDELALVDKGELKLFDSDLNGKVLKDLSEEAIGISIDRGTIVVLTKNNLYTYKKQNIRSIGVENPLSLYKNAGNVYVVYKDKIVKVEK
ncbi:hypothetical protein [uncultured Helcococcus sp.]|uniref:hypothetical protein n=1 Tax=uncultured Helcococcus sp. TaxID=1072508 RepID=UPI0028899E2F|nr:hypothetical protein [uncultured Helcococcus sp.]